MAREGQNAAAGKKKLVLRPSSIITIIFFSITAICLAYIAGVMSGRHGSIMREKPAETVLAGPESSKEEVQSEKILTPEELDFARVLKGQPARRVIEPEKVEEMLPSEQEDAQTAENAGPEPVSSQPVEVGGKYDFLFQLAAFKEEAGADTLRQLLEGAGYRTILEKKGKILIVLVRMRGTEANANELKDLASKLKLGPPLQKQKKPVQP